MCLEFKEVLAESALLGSRFANVTSTACARTVSTVSQRLVNLARRIARTAPEDSDGSEEGETLIAKKCRRGEEFVGRVMLDSFCSEGMEVDHWYI